MQPAVLGTQINKYRGKITETGCVLHFGAKFWSKTYVEYAVVGFIRAVVGLPLWVPCYSKKPYYERRHHVLWVRVSYLQPRPSMEDLF